jgi:hypothetical protein
MLQRLRCAHTGERRTPADGPPMFFFLGGGMAAGKSTAVQALSSTEWWQRHSEHVVIVSADEFKHQDPIFGSDSSDLHSRSTKAAEMLLVRALNEGRDIVFDGTMTWTPFVEQTIAMVRRAHATLFENGAGYLPASGVEQYFCSCGDREEALPLPYCVKMVGVFTDPRIAVPRAITRQLATGRSVPAQSLLRSFRLFAAGFEAHAALCDEVVLFNNNVWKDLSGGELPDVAVTKERGEVALTVVDEPAYAAFLRSVEINDVATCSAELYE